MFHKLFFNSGKKIIFFVFFGKWNKLNPSDGQAQWNGVGNYSHGMNL